MSYTLQPLLKIREMREDRARGVLVAARRALAVAEEALAASNRKFRRRWAAMEAQADLDQLDTAALNELWDDVKRDELH